jgi:hypothetical protein
MADAIAEYQTWKQRGEVLRAQAKQAIESRFRELLIEAVRLAQEYQADFGTNLKPPPPVTAFRYKSSGAGKKGAKPKKANPPIVESKARDPGPDSKILGLKKQLTETKRRLNAAKASGKSTKNFEDKVYEIEDALRLAASAIT